MLYKFFVLVYGKIFLAENKRDKDVFSAIISASVQVALLITLNLISGFFMVYAFLKDYVSFDMVGADRKYFLAIVAFIMLVLIVCVYRAASSINVAHSYQDQLDREKSSRSKLLAAAKVYPVFSMVGLALSVGLLIMQSQAGL